VAELGEVAVHDALRTQLESYLQRIVDRDFAELGHPIRNPLGLRRWISAYAAATATTTSFERIRDAASGGSDRPPAKTTFESLVTQSVKVYAQAAEATVGHPRLQGGTREIDLIVDRGDGRAIAIEVKLSAGVRNDAVRHLNWLKSTIGDDLLDRVVVTTGGEAYRRPDGIAVVPAALLGP
jgi:predicted AAA+ superfamily ATPase